MTKELTLADYAARLRAFMNSTVKGLRPDSARREEDQDLVTPTAADFEALALELFRLQFDSNEPYRRFCEFRGFTPGNVLSWHEIPAVPTSAFKELELTSLPISERTNVFFSSGTTAQRRSRHFHNADSLAVYEASLLPWFERHLLPEVDDANDEPWPGPEDARPSIALTPPPTEAPNSSLVHMFDCVQRAFGARASVFTGRVDSAGTWSLDVDATIFVLRKSMCANRPVVLLGTAFNFVHLLDHFAANNMRYRLARGSRVLETGGYKNQSREVPKTELHALMTKHLGIELENIVTEYGMSELSSQAYDGVAGEARSERAFRFPPWARARVISPETNREVPEGQTGLLRIFDLANLRSVMAIQTEDLAVRRGDGFELLGRAPVAEPRGCSLMSHVAE